MQATRATVMVWAAYVGVIVIGGSNFVAVSMSNEGLAPFWGAGVRFTLAAAAMVAIVSLAGIEMPRGPSLTGAVAFGVVGFGVAYACGYWALQDVPAGMLSVMLATAPLITAFLAPLHRLEKLRPRTVLGGTFALAGVAVVLREQVTLDAPWPALAAGVGFAFAMAESTVIVKRFPRAHPLATNGVAMAVGGALLLALSWATREAWTTPATWRSAGAVLYLVSIGSIGLFALLLYTVARLPVTVTSYQTAFMPLVTVVLASWLLDQAVTVSLLLGAALVFLGLYFGLGGTRPAAVAPPAALPAPPAQPAATAVPQEPGRHDGSP